MFLVAALVVQLSAVFDGAKIAVAWPDPAGEIRFARVAPSPQVVPSGVVVGHGDAVKVGVVDDAYVVAWRDGASLLAERVDRDGNVLDVEPIVVSDNALAWDLAANGHDALLVWATPGYQLRTAHLGAAGAIALNPVPVATNPYEPLWIDLACRTTCLAAWMQLDSPRYPHALIPSHDEAIALDPNGLPLSSVVRLPVVSSPVVTTFGDRFVVADPSTHYIVVDRDLHVLRSHQINWRTTIIRAFEFAGRPVLTWNAGNIARRLDENGDPYDDFVLWKEGFVPSDVVVAGSVIFAVVPSGDGVTLHRAGGKGRAVAH